tara:strand:- start:336 stop:1208 length:873 start_codon:yes stop_codon:yes gene_type:complete
MNLSTLIDQMFKRILIPALSFFSLFTSLFAEFVPLKGSNGKMVEFLVESVEPDGVMAQYRGAYKFSLIRWEQLDLEWLKQNQKAIWKEKQQHEANKQAAYGAFRFGQSLSEVVKMIQALDGERVHHEAFNDTDASALWINLNPKDTRQFLRFSFDGANKLSEIQLHTNFDEEQAIEAEMRTEWERLIALVEGCGGIEEEKRSFPRSSEWRRWQSEASADKQSIWLTHRWGDELRQFELGLESKQVKFGGGDAVITGRTRFGYTVSSGSMDKTFTNWVVYKVTLKSRSGQK